MKNGGAKSQSQSTAPSQPAVRISGLDGYELLKLPMLSGMVKLRRVGTNVPLYAVMVASVDPATGAVELNVGTPQTLPQFVAKEHKSKVHRLDLLAQQ